MTLNLITVNGTASYPTDPTNFPSMVAYALLPSPWQLLADKIDGLGYPPLINWFPLDYPMATYPMGASVNTGITNLVAMINSIPAGQPIMVLAYSQGAIVWSTVWRDQILNPAGALHERLGDIKATCCWGNPMRAPNVCHGNSFAGWIPQAGGGISGTNDLLPNEVPSWWFDFADSNDLYTDSPVAVSSSGTSIVMNGTATDEQLIYDMIVTESFGGTLVGLLKLVESAVSQLHAPISEVIGIATAIYNGLTFLSAGPAAGHYTYDPAPAIAYTRAVALQYL